MNYPSATYRVQLNSQFTFKKLTKIIDYLHQLGISTIYTGPITTSQKDSGHGYDVTDPGQVNPQIGTLEEWREISKKLHHYGMTWLQDIVPNHMAFSSDNHRLMDVLERGIDSPYYTYFDIDWHHKKTIGKIWIPVLGSDEQAALDNNEITIGFEADGFKLHYYEQSFPLAVSAVKAIVLYIRSHAESPGLAFAIEDLIKSAHRRELDVWNKHKEKYTKEIIERFPNELQHVLNIINGDKKNLAKIIHQQPYTLTHWETSETQMNYRRFFTINNLICLRMEDKSVFDDYHSFFYFLFREKLIQGLRIDHIDGLYDPQEYVKRLRKKMGDSCYIIAEKILEYNEDLTKDWNIEGTSGYEFLSFSNRLLTDAKGVEKLLTFYRAFTGMQESYEDLVFRNKHNFLYSQMRGELDNLMSLLDHLDLISKTKLEEERIKKALGFFMAAFPVYRIYPSAFPLSDEAMQLVNKALDKACQKEIELQQEFEFIRSLFDEDQTEIAKRKLAFIMRLMQFTSPLAAKGVEDTTFYVYNPLISHNEVGDAPNELAISVDAFHQKMISRQNNNPYSLNSSSTHDTKRGEDARARINVLSYVHEEWVQLVMQWKKENQVAIKKVNGRRAPSLNDEYYIYQSLLGSFPENLKADENFVQRTHQFILKALHEAKVETFYTKPDEAYEQACIHFIDTLLSVEHTFLNSFVPFLKKVICFSSIYSLVQTVLKITAPGIPDIYQGSELWELSYVDPDNRREVDYTFRQNLLNEMMSQSENLLSWTKSKREEGAEKLFVTATLLHLRKKSSKIFLKGDYVPLLVNAGEDRCVAYLRKHGEQCILVVLPIGFEMNEAGDFTTSWKDVTIELPHHLPLAWTNVFTGKAEQFKHSIDVVRVFQEFPVAVYESKSIL